ncbi:phasin family protein [Rhodoblastus sp.]|uniref:phasin family protein n=1 Tax=Rhodoblastus sp. TaxID=1962975 RepID=UPI002613CAB4|nr:phasin family protein [Rhodoblastus sp.]
MAKKLKALVEGKSDSELAALIKNSANQIWLAGLGAFAKAQEEGTKVFDALVKEGEGVQERARKTADEKIADVKAKATGQWDKLEQVFEERVARALHSLSVPTRKDVEALSRRVSELTHEVKKLAGEVEEKKTPAKIAK